MLRRRRIAGNGRLLQLRLVGRWRDELDQPLLGCREQNLEALDLGIKAEARVLVAKPLGVLLVVGRSHVMRPCRQALHHVAESPGIGDGLEFRFPVALHLRRLRGEATEGSGFRRGRKEGEGAEGDER